MKNTCKIGYIRLTNVRNNLTGLIFRKFVRNYTHILKKILQIFVKLGKLSLVELAAGVELSSLHFGHYVSFRGPFLTSPLGANFDPQGRSCPQGVNLSPRGEVIPWG
jgi:hypothetical protein